MLTCFAGLVVLVSCLFIGSWLLPPASQLARSRWEGGALALLCGTSFVALAGSAVLAFRFDFNLVVVLTLGMAILAAVVQGKRRREPSLRPAPLDFSLPALSVLVLLGLASVVASIALPINEFDPMLHFAYKGQILAAHGSAFDEALTGMLDENGEIREFGRIITHPNYPFGVPILEALVAKIGGDWDARWVQLPLAFWSLCLPAVVFFGMRQVGRSAARAAALVAACVPILYARNIGEGHNAWEKAGLGNEFTLGAGADLPVAALLAGACALFLHGRMHEGPIGRRLQLLGGLCLAGAVTMKNEGLALFGCVVLALVLSGAVLPVGKSRKAGVHSLMALALGVLLIAPWLYLRGQLPAIDENYGSQFTLDKIMHFLGGGAELVEKAPKSLVGQGGDTLANPPARIDLLPGYFWSEFIDWRSWGIFWLLAAMALPWKLRELLDTNRRWIIMLSLGGVALYFLILLVTPWYLPLLRDKGIPERLLLHLVGPIAMMIGYRFGGTPAHRPMHTLWAPAFGVAGLLLVLGPWYEAAAFINSDDPLQTRLAGYQTWAGQAAAFYFVMGLFGTLKSRSPKLPIAFFGLAMLTAAALIAFGAPIELPPSERPLPKRGMLEGAGWAAWAALLFSGMALAAAWEQRETAKAVPQG